VIQTFSSIQKTKLVFALKTEAIKELGNKVVEEKRFKLLDEKKKFSYCRIRIEEGRSSKGQGREYTLAFVLDEIAFQFRLP
jgi:hypothetical protein